MALPQNFYGFLLGTQSLVESKIQSTNQNRTSTNQIKCAIDGTNLRNQNTKSDKIMQKNRGGGGSAATYISTEKSKIEKIKALSFAYPQNRSKH